MLGTDEFERDIASLVLHGSRVPLLVGGVTMVLTSLGGVVIGLVAGYYRRLDLVIMRVMDGLMVFPAILLAIALMDVLGPGVWNVIDSLSIVYPPRTAMLIRSTALSVRELDYALAAQALGRGGLAIAFRHILPNCVGPLLVQGTSSSPTPCSPRRSWASSPWSCRPTRAVGQRDRQRKERHRRGILGECLSGPGPDGGRPVPEPPGRRAPRHPRLPAADGCSGGSPPWAVPTPSIRIATLREVEASLNLLAHRDRAGA